MTSKDFFKTCFAQSETAESVQTMFRNLMNEMCNACTDRQAELKGDKKSKKALDSKVEPAVKLESKTSTKAKAKTETKVESKAEPKKTTAKTKAKAEPKTEAPEVEVIKLNKRAIAKLGLQYVDYSEKAFAIVGDTKPIKDELKTLKGRFNSRLSVDGKQVAGWVFAKRNAEPVKKSLFIA